MGFLSRFESKVEDTMEGAANRVLDAPISPVQISKKAEKQMRREKIVGAGKAFAPTLYTVLVNEDDDARMFGFYPTLAGEIETFLSAKAAEQGLVMDGQPLVRFIVDESLKHGKFEVIAEPVAAPIISQLREEEMQRYGLAAAPMQRGYAQPQQPMVPVAQNDPFAPSDPRDPFAPSNQSFGNEDIDPLPAADSAVAVTPRTMVFDNDQNAYAGKVRLINVSTNNVVVLNRAQMVCGRGEGVDIPVMDINASRRHAQLSREAHGVWVLTDLGSVNGTLLNGQIIESPETLYEGDRITMGLTTFVFTMA